MGEFYKELEARVAEQSLDLTISLDLRDRNALEEAIPALQADLTRVRKFCDENMTSSPP